MVKTYSKTKDGNVQISPNFKIAEFAVKCSPDRCPYRGRCNPDIIKLDDRLPGVLQRVRALCGNKPLNINSGYRNPEHNAKIGGAPKSLHMDGMAADITIAGLQPLAMCRAAETALAEAKIPGGICLYVKQSFIHVDVRAARWRGQDDGDGVRNVQGWSPMPSAPSPPAPTPPSQAQPKEKAIWDFIRGKGLNDYAIAGIMGNMFAESGLETKILQHSCKKSLGHTDESYTAGVDDGSYTNFIRDGAGYGLCQWTHWSRKEELLNFARSRKVSIADLQMQLSFFWQELLTYSPLMSTLRNAKDLFAASKAVMLQYLKPANQGAVAQERRAGYGQGYYDKFAEKSTPSAPLKPVFYTVRITGEPLNVRQGPGTNHPTTGQLKKGTLHNITHETAGDGAKLWGHLETGGWIALDFTAKI